MSEIGSIGGGASAREISKPLRAEREGDRPGDQARSASRSADRVEVSSLARELSQLQDPIRQDLVDRIRAEIEAGTYETQERLDGATEGLLRDITQG